MTDRDIKRWIKERDAVALSYDIKKFRKFYEKWQKRGLYTMPLPKDDIVIEIAMRKMVCSMESATEEQYEEALSWLKERGYSEL